MNRIIEDDVGSIANSIEYEKLRGKSVLITGATGMLASYIVFLLHHLNQTQQCNIQIWLLVRSSVKAQTKFGGILEDDFVHVVVQDVCSPIEIAGSIDYIVHGASMADPHSISERPFEVIKANSVRTFQVCEFARQKKSKVLFLSTREVYGEVSGYPKKINEHMYGALDPMNARNCYPESKRVAEATLLSCYNEYGVPFNIVRIAHAFGPGMAIDNDGRIMADLMHSMVNHENVVLKSDGTMNRAFCYVADAVCAIMLVLLNGETGAVYNIANETEETTVVELANKIASAVNRTVCFQAQDKTENCKQYLQTPRVPLDVTALQKLGWTPKVSLWDGIMRTYNYNITEHHA